MNGWIVLFFALGGLVFDMCSLLSYKIFGTVRGGGPDDEDHYNDSSVSPSSLEGGAHHATKELAPEHAVVYLGGGEKAAGGQHHDEGDEDALTCGINTNMCGTLSDSLVAWRLFNSSCIITLFIDHDSNMFRFVSFPLLSFSGHLAALLHILSDLMRSTTTLVEAIVILEYKGVCSTQADGIATLAVCAIIIVGVRLTKKACNSSTMTILAPIALLGRECYAYYLFSLHGNVNWS